jgi:hypothetical protein
VAVGETVTVAVCVVDAVQVRVIAEIFVLGRGRMRRSLGLRWRWRWRWWERMRMRRVVRGAHCCCGVDVVGGRKLRWMVVELLWRGGSEGRLWACRGPILWWPSWWLGSGGSGDPEGPGKNARVNPGRNHRKRSGDGGGGRRVLEASSGGIRCVYLIAKPTRARGLWLLALW